MSFKIAVKRVFISDLLFSIVSLGSCAEWFTYCIPIFAPISVCQGHKRTTTLLSITFSQSKYFSFRLDIAIQFDFVKEPFAVSRVHEKPLNDIYILVWLASCILQLYLAASSSAITAVNQKVFCTLLKKTSAAMSTACCLPSMFFIDMPIFFLFIIFSLPADFFLYTIFMSFSRHFFLSVIQ